MPMDTAALSQMMSEQGAGQGVDFNGEPTPNISGQPSFADMYQEIKKRYDTLILPLERQLMKLKKELEGNPTDETIKNEIKRIEEKIDRLEQQEDMEIQQLEAEVEKSGQMIDQQKEDMGMPPQEKEMPEFMPLAEQQMPQEGMPMMQKGGKISKHQYKPIEYEQIQPVYMPVDRTGGLGSALNYQQQIYNNLDAQMASEKEAERIRNLNDVNAILEGYKNAAEKQYIESTVGTIKQARDYNPNRAQYEELKKSYDAAASAFGRSIGANYDMTADELNNWNLNMMELAGWMAAPEVMSAVTTPYYLGTGQYGNAALASIPLWRPFGNAIKSVSKSAANGLRSMGGKIGLDSRGIRIGDTIYGPDPNTLNMGFKIRRTPAGSVPAAGQETIAQKVKNKYGADWSKIEDLDIYTDRSRAQNEALFNRLENGELEIVGNGNGGHVIREAKNPKVSAEHAATAETSAEAQNTTGGNPREKMTDEEYLKDVLKGTQENWQKVKSAAGTGIGNVLKGVGRPVANLLSATVNYASNAPMRAFSLRRPVDTSRNLFEIPTGKKFFLEFPEWRGKEIYTTMPVSHTMRGVNMFRNSLNAAGTAATRIGFPLMGYNLFSSFFRDNTNEAYNEEKQNNAINEYKSSAASGTITPLSSATGSASENDTVKADVKDTMQNTNETPQEILDALKEFNITQDKEVPTKQLGGWFDSLLKDIDEKHPSGIKRYLKEVPWTQHVMMGNMLGNVLDMSGKNNIEAQHQFRYANNPYTQVYDRANREYNRQMNDISRKYDLDDLRLSRQKQYPQYSSLQHMNHARLAQSEIDNTNRMTNMSNRMTSIQNVANVFGKSANDAFQNMYEQNYKNAILNENERKSYLSAINKYNNEKLAAYNNMINIMALAGKEQKRNDMLYGEVMKNYLTGLKMGIDGNLLYAALRPFFQNLDLPQQPVQNGKQ